MPRGALVLSLLFWVPAGAQGPSARDWRAFDEYVARAVREWEAPGLAIAVVHGRDAVFQRGYGVRALGSSGAVDEHTLFANASTTKAFTAMALAMLVDEGRLSFDDPVVRWLPGFRLFDPWVTRELRLRDLLSHRVGFGDPGWLWYGRDDDFETILARLAHVEPATSFRSAYAYNNVTFATAGVIAGVAADQSWDQVVRERILDPLAMTETITRGEFVTPGSNIALPHGLVNDTLRALGVLSAADPIPSAGAMYSSVADMSRWLAFLLDSARVNGRRLVAPGTFAQMFQPQTVIRSGQFYPTSLRTHPHVTAYGLGWFLQDYRGEWIAFHTGSIDGYVAIVGLMPERNVGVVVFANRDHVEVRHALMWRVFDMYLDGAPRDWSTELHAMYDSLAAVEAALDSTRLAERKHGTVASLDLGSYVGDYTDEAFGTGTVTLDGDHLVWTVSAFLTADLEHWHLDTFRTRWRNRWVGDGFLTFRLAQDGTVQGVEIRGIELRRVPR